MCSSAFLPPGLRPSVYWQPLNNMATTSKALLSCLPILALGLGMACGSDSKGGQGVDGAAPDGPLVDAADEVDSGSEGASDAGKFIVDAGEQGDASTVSDAAISDAAAAADASSVDAAILDAATITDASLPDASVPDAAIADAALPDAEPDAAVLGVACQTGPGRTLWRISWPANQGGFARVDVWDNGCDFSVGDQACRFSGEPHDYADFGPGIEFDSSSDFFRIRYSVAGLSFSNATLYMSAHADGSGIPFAQLDSPIHGGLSFAPTVPISTHRTYAIDWTDFLTPSDPPSLTAVTLRSNPIGLAVSFMELCVQ